MTTTLTPQDIYETHGDFEELIDPVSYRCIGTRHIEHDASRPYGVAGLRKLTITEPFEVRRGHKFVRVLASAKKPVVVNSMAHAICGRKIAIA